MAEQQQLQQQGLPATTEEDEEENTKNPPGAFTYDTDVPSIDDIWKIQTQTPPGSALRAKVLGPGALGAAAGNQTTTAGNQTSQVQATINSQAAINTPTLPKVLLNPPPNSGPLPDNEAPLSRGCKIALYGRVSPQWVTVKPYPYDTVVAEGVITPSRHYHSTSRVAI